MYIYIPMHMYAYLVHTHIYVYMSQGAVVPPRDGDSMAMAIWPSGQSHHSARRLPMHSAEVRHASPNRAMLEVKVACHANP